MEVNSSNILSEFVATLKDQVRLITLFYRLQFSQSVKSPLNLWIATLVQIVYFASQGFFWFAIFNTDAGKSWMTTQQILGFMVTVAMVDNFYLFTIGRGSMVLMQKVESRSLDPILLWPRSSLGTLVFMNPNWTYFPCAVISIVLFLIYHIHYSSNVYLIFSHLIACVLGVFVMDGISFIFRTTIFWSRAFARLRNANPSYKILVRPSDSFESGIKLFLLTLFPALFITGVPADIGMGSKGDIWILYGLIACIFTWLIVGSMWRLGLRRYNLKEH